MSYTYRVDADGDRHYDQPEDWSLDKRPEDMNNKELAAATARLMGCSPRWWPYYMDWICTCKNLEHAADSQCSVIADYAGRLSAARQVAQWMEREGHKSLGMTAAPREVCEQALEGGE
jgi:hypothetical protein